MLHSSEKYLYILSISFCILSISEKNPFLKKDPHIFNKPYLPNSIKSNTFVYFSIYSLKF